MNIFKSKDKDLVFIDNVLKLLSNNVSNGVSFEHIINELDVTKITIKFADKSKLVFDYVEEKSWETNYYLASCLSYLIQNGFVIRPYEDNYRITFNGILKIKTNTFAEQGFTYKWGSPREFILLLIAVLSLIISLTVSLCS